jgi:peptide/nickel transport system substrate-binding protein
VPGGADAKKGERGPDQDRKAGDAQKRNEDRRGERGRQEQKHNEQQGHEQKRHEQQGREKQRHGKQGEKRSGKNSRVTAPRVKAGKPLTLRFVLPAGRASKPVRATGARIAKELGRIGVRTRIQQVPAERYFANIAAGDYDLAIYSWPGTAFPATDARPIFAKPSAAADGSLLVEQNYTRVGTNQIDQLFDQASRELDDGVRNDLIKRADARIWAAAGSVPLYQRPQLVAAGEKVANAGAFGFQTPRYQDIGFEK